VQASLSSLWTGTGESSGTLLAVQAGTQDALPLLPYTPHSPLSHTSPDPPQLPHSTHTQHSGSSHSPLSLLYCPYAINTPASLSAFSFIHPFGSAPGSFHHIKTPPVSAALARSQVSQHSEGHHARKSSLVTGFAPEALYPSGSAYTVRHSPPASPTEFSTPLTPYEPASTSPISPSLLAL
jgi:hypothetical protein